MCIYHFAVKHKRQISSLKTSYGGKEARTMPKNKGKGGKNRRRGKNESEEKRQLNQKQAGQGKTSRVFLTLQSTAKC